jgi:hypothetical protein
VILIFNILCLRKWNLPFFYPELPGCHTQAKTLDELNSRIKEAIELYLEVEQEK